MKEMTAGAVAHDRKRGVRRTTLWLALLAAGIYLGFIALSVWRGS